MLRKYGPLDKAIKALELRNKRNIRKCLQSSATHVDRA